MQTNIRARTKSKQCFGIEPLEPRDYLAADFFAVVRGDQLLIDQNHDAFHDVEIQLPPGSRTVLAMDLTGQGTTEPVIVVPNAAGGLTWKKADGTAIGNFGLIGDIPLTGNLDGRPGDEMVVVRIDQNWAPQWLANLNDDVWAELDFECGRAGDRFYLADVDGDGIDRPVIARARPDGIFNELFFYESLGGSPTRSQIWGFTTDQLNFADLLGVGRDVPIASRAYPDGLVHHFIDLNGDPNHEAEQIYGLATAQAVDFVMAGFSLQSLTQQTPEVATAPPAPLPSSTTPNPNISSVNKTGVDVRFDPVEDFGIHRINVDGTNLLTGCGFGFIGSATGSDNKGNITSCNPNNHGIMMPFDSDANSLSLPFNLQFRVDDHDPSIVHFAGDIGPSLYDFATVSMPMDARRDIFTHFRHSGTSYTTGAEGHRVNSSIGYFSDNRFTYPHEHGPVNIAQADGIQTWGEIISKNYTVRVTLTGKTRPMGLFFVDHPDTRNVEFSFGRVRVGERASVTGTIQVTRTDPTVFETLDPPAPTSPPQSPSTVTSLTLEAERDLAHEIGDPEGTAWATTVTDGPGFASYGPYVTTIAAGRFDAKYRLEIDNNSADNAKVARIDVFDATSGQLLAQQTIRRRDFHRANTYQDFTLQFVAAGNGNKIEFRTEVYGNGKITQDRVTMVPHIASLPATPTPVNPTPQPNPTVSSLTLEAERDLSHHIGRPEGSAWSTNVRDGAGFASYGPYVTTITAGKYEAKFRLRVDNNSADNVKIARIDIYDATADRILSQKTIRRRDFGRPNNYQDFALQFTAPGNSHKIEFRVEVFGNAKLDQDRITVKRR